jgi:hypothetical protein
MKDEADIVAETLRETEPAKVLERRREALERFYEAKQHGDEDDGRASPATEAPAAKEPKARRGGSWKLVLAAGLVAVLSPFAVILSGHFKETTRKTTPAAVPTLAPAVALDSAPTPTAPPAPSATATASASAVVPSKPAPKHDAGRPTPGEVW